MPRISQEKKVKIQEQILHYLFSISPASTFTNKIARETARDEEFAKSLLSELKSKGLVVEINKSPLGNNYIRRQRWRLSGKAFEAYKNVQNNKTQNI